MKSSQVLEDLKHGDAETAMEAAKAVIAKRLKIPISKIERIAIGTSHGDWGRVSAIYLLGNLRSKKSAPLLAKILENEKEKPIFREYAAEALGNIGDSRFLPVIASVAGRTTSPEIRESCEFALQEIPAIEGRRAVDEER